MLSRAVTLDVGGCLATAFELFYKKEEEEEEMEEEMEEEEIELEEKEEEEEDSFIKILSGRLFSSPTNGACTAIFFHNFFPCLLSAIFPRLSSWRS